jgi:ectoine hydroxylase-related dioxygenase (phytanoyl-CoA dioxygenase family)
MDIEKTINEQGLVVLRNLFPAEYIKELNAAFPDAIAKECEYHKTTDYYYYGSLLLAPLYGGPFIRIFEHPAFYLPFERILGEECIVYAYTTSCIPPHSSIYTKRIHVDSPRIIKGYHTSLIGMVLVSDFTPENGAPYFLLNSQEMEEQPDESYFFEHAVQITGKAGDVIYFNPRIWHTGSLNNTDQWRHSIIMGMQRAWMKQRFDIPRALAQTDISGLSEKSLQKLGFYSQPPASYDEYYLPKEARTYRQKTT